MTKLLDAKSITRSNVRDKKSQLWHKLKLWEGMGSDFIMIPDKHTQCILSHNYYLIYIVILTLML